METEPELVDPLEGREKLKIIIKNSQILLISLFSTPKENPIEASFLWCTNKLRLNFSRININKQRREEWI